MRRAYSDMVDLVKVASRDPAPDDTVIAALQTAVAARVVNRREAVATIMMLLAAGIATTAVAIGTGIARLMWSGAVLRSMLASEQTASLLVEELLRHHPPAPFSPWRFTRAAVEVDGTVIPANSVVFVLLAAANRDPAVFADPDELRPGRSTSGHLSFGQGPHYCIGAHLARHEVTIALQMLFDRLPHVRPAVPYTDIAWRGLLFDRTMNAFPVLTGAASTPADEHVKASWDSLPPRTPS
ncbi:cytochrome P450 [Jatrophihabitans sp. GAS493]|nr:cytochrome P450 [Jatrophihabitans sp. GAS493]